MTTAAKITLAISVATALGVGALLKAWVDHLLQGRERKLNIADKSVQIAEAIMTRMEAELTRVQEALAKAQQQNKELQTERGLTNDKVDVELAKARDRIHDVQADVTKMRGGLGRGVGALIPTPPPGEVLALRERNYLQRAAMEDARRMEQRAEQALAHRRANIAAKRSEPDPPPIDEDIRQSMRDRDRDDQYDDSPEG